MLYNLVIFKEGGFVLERTITIIVGGKKVNLNPFVKRAGVNVIMGLLKSLRDVNVDEEISITISRP